MQKSKSKSLEQKVKDNFFSFFYINAHNFRFNCVVVHDLKNIFNIFINTHLHSEFLTYLLYLINKIVNVIFI